MDTKAVIFGKKINFVAFEETTKLDPLLVEDKESHYCLFLSSFCKLANASLHRRRGDMNVLVAVNLLESKLDIELQ